MFIYNKIFKFNFKYYHQKQSPSKVNKHKKETKLF